MICDVDHLFICPLAICMLSLEKMSVHVLCPVLNWFVFLIFSCMSSVNILNITPSSERVFANILSQSVACLSVLLLVSLTVQKLSGLLQSLFIFAVVTLAWGDRSKNTLLRPVSENLLPKFSSRSFTVSDLTFKSLSDVWMVSPTQWTWVWADSGRWWRTGKPGVLPPTRLQRVGHNLVTREQQQIVLSLFCVWCKKMV